MRGRGFSEQDRRGDPDVAVINETLAARFGGRDPVGERIRLLRVPNSCPMISSTLFVPASAAGTKDVEYTRCGL